MPWLLPASATPLSPDAVNSLRLSRPLPTVPPMSTPADDDDYNDNISPSKASLPPPEPTIVGHPDGPSKSFITTVMTSTFQICRGRKPTMITVDTRGKSYSPVINKFIFIPLQSPFIITTTTARACCPRPHLHRRCCRMSITPPPISAGGASRLHARCPHKLPPRLSQWAWIERSRPHIMRPSCWPHLCRLTSPMSPSPSPSSDARTCCPDAIAPSARTACMHRSPELTARMHAPRNCHLQHVVNVGSAVDDRRFALKVAAKATVLAATVPNEFFL
ncbi:hypothetical protein ACLOJK_005175 [Asimina triloba]